MNIFIKFQGNHFTFDLKHNTKIHEVKQLIYSECGINIQQQRLIYSGNELNNSMNLNDYVIGNDSTIQLSISIMGGGAGSSAEAAGDAGGDAGGENIAGEDAKKTFDNTAESQETTTAAKNYIDAVTNYYDENNTADEATKKQAVDEAAKKFQETLKTNKNISDYLDKEYKKNGKDPQKVLEDVVNKMTKSGKIPKDPTLDDVKKWVSDEWNSRTWKDNLNTAGKTLLGLEGVSVIAGIIYAELNKPKDSDDDFTGLTGGCVLSNSSTGETFSVGYCGFDKSENSYQNSDPPGANGAYCSNTCSNNDDCEQNGTCDDDGTCTYNSNTNFQTLIKNGNISLCAKNTGSGTDNYSTTYTACPLSSLMCDYITNKGLCTNQQILKAAQFYDIPGINDDKDVTNMTSNADWYWSTQCVSPLQINYLMYMLSDMDSYKYTPEESFVTKSLFIISLICIIIIFVYYIYKLYKQYK